MASSSIANSTFNGQRNFINTDLRILFWNARSLLRRKEELLKTLSKVDICICAETWLNDNSDPFDLDFPGFITLREDRVGSLGGGIIFIVRKSIGYRKIDDLDFPKDVCEMIGITITNIKEPINIVALYKPTKYTLSQEQWDSILANINVNGRWVLVGDFNAHNQAWNCLRNDTDGRRLQHSIHENSIFLHNYNTLTRYDQAHDTWSNIDLILSTQNIAHLINYRVHDVSWGSDHLPVFFDFSVEKAIYRKRSFKLQTKKTNWPQVISILSQKHERFFDQEYNILGPTEKYEFYYNDS